jgi:hypothetical protein
MTMLHQTLLLVCVEMLSSSVLDSEKVLAMHMQETIIPISISLPYI